MSPQPENVVIIGGGPAGYSAAIYAARAGLSPLLYEGPQPGGQLTTTSEVENYPGYPKGVLGPEMMVEFREQAARFGTRIVRGVVTQVELTERPFRVVIDAANHVTTQSLIIATGACAKWLGLPSEERLNGRGVSACAVCDGFFFKGREVAVVGGGDSAAEEACYLAKLCTTVHLLVRKDHLRASKIMQKRLLGMANIILHWQQEVQEVLGERQVTGVRLYNNATAEQSILPLQGLFIAIGHQPNTALFTGELEHDALGYLKTAPDSTYTNIPGVFVAGDAQDKRYRQAVTAAGTGCMAALDAERFLATL